MAEDNPNEQTASQQEVQGEGENKQNEQYLDALSSDSSKSLYEHQYDSDDSSYYNEEENEPLDYGRRGEEMASLDNTPESNFRLFSRALDSRRVKRRQELEDEEYELQEEIFDFPEDPEKWTEEDLQELWMDAPLYSMSVGWDPLWADEEEWELVTDEVERGNDPPIAPFYIPYRQPYPLIPDDNYDVSSPKAVIEELDRIEEFLRWVSYIFPDGSSYVFYVR